MDNKPDARHPRSYSLAQAAWIPRITIWRDDGTTQRREGEPCESWAAMVASWRLPGAGDQGCASRRIRRTRVMLFVPMRRVASGSTVNRAGARHQSGGELENRRKGNPSVSANG